MKKISLMLCVMLLCVSVLSACTGGDSKSPADVSIAVIKGPSSIGMIKLMDEADSGEITTNNFAFELYPNADEIVTKIVQGEIDIAAVPPNLASVLHNNTQGGVRVIAIGTLGMMYIVENGDTIHSIEDLRGRTVYAGFRGKSPEYDLNYILSANGIDPETDLNIEWKSEHTEAVAALSTSDNAIAVLPQPFVTIAQMSNENLRIVLDLNQEWGRLQEQADNPSALITGVIVARTEFIEQNPDAVADFLDRYAASVKYVNANVDAAAESVGKYDIFPVPVAQRAIPYCNITFIEGAEMREKLSGYLRVLFEQNPQSVGGANPNDEFYFIR